MSYRFIYRQNKKLPKLSWLATIDKRTNDVIVDCGQSVECLDTFFVAGAWDGAFLSAGFDASEVFYGSGCKIEQDGLVFCTPSHSLMRLVFFENDDNIVLSNSTPFLLSQTGLTLSKSINQYERIFCSVLDGPEKMIKDIPLADGRHFSQAIVSLIRISAKKEISIVPRAKQAPFTDFTDYKMRLSDTMQRLRRNAADKERGNSSFGVVSTISSGYDSSACSAIAKEIGCDTVVSLKGGRYDKDNGFKIAKQLGYSTIIGRDMDSYRQKTGLVDAEVLADGELGTALQFTVFDDIFENNLVFFGLRGSYWSITASMTSEYEMIGYFNCEADTSFTEHSLQHGYLIVPLPTFGASACESIFAITNSDEMKPWSIGGAYDKPIPRRILESKGVERESFGMVKYGGGGSFSRDNKSRLKSRMSVEGYQSFSQFLKDKKGLRWSLKRIGQLIKYVLLNLPVYCNYIFSKLHIKLYFKQKPIRYANPGIAAELIFWGTDVMCTRYKNVMNQ